MSERPTNRLAREKSPYLLQHAHNPVDWYPWSEEAFARARAEGKPIFLSIGYSTCHWCHVMERESFENDDIARLMNENFINIKVDREERPDVDQVYMTFVQATTGGGGWPMSVFLTPDLKPFFGGTYFPPDNRYGRPGFPALLMHIVKSWEEKREDLQRSGDRIVAALQKGAADGGTPRLLDRTVLVNAQRVFAQAFDQESPGFGQQPKFPRPVVLNFLLRYFARTGDEEPANMVLATLGVMARGGIHDHLGGGFHRYAVDRYWHVPHFEKMLYDQAQLVVSYLEAYQIWREPNVADVARSIIDYLLRDLTDEKTGGFFSAEDADSPVRHGDRERKEGAFYVFTKEEIDEVVGLPEADVFNYHYGVEPGGNAEDPHGELTGKNVLHRMHSLAETAEHFGRGTALVEALLAEARSKLFAHRARRPRPHLDDKILAAWNGLMISGLARAAQVLDDLRALQAAARAARFCAEKLYDEATGVVYRRYRDGDVAGEGTLDDYALLAQGLLDLYEASFDVRWLKLAERITEKQNELFYDREGGGFWATSGKDPSVLVRMKDDYDGAEPSGNSAATLNLIRLGHLLDRPDWLKMAQETVRFFSERLAEAPQALPQMLVAFDYLLESPVQIVIAGERSDARTEALLRAVHDRFVPTRILLLANEAARSELGDRLKHIAGMTPIDGKPAAYVCRDWSCDRPVTDPRELAQKLGAREMQKPGGGEGEQPAE